MSTPFPQVFRPLSSRQPIISFFPFPCPFLINSCSPCLCLSPIKSQSFSSLSSFPVPLTLLPSINHQSFLSPFILYPPAATNPPFLYSCFSCIHPNHTLPYSSPVVCSFLFSICVLFPSDSLSFLLSTPYLLQSPIPSPSNNHPSLLPSSASHPFAFIVPRFPPFILPPFIHSSYSLFSSRHHSPIPPPTFQLPAHLTLFQPPFPLSLSCLWNMKV